MNRIPCIGNDIVDWQKARVQFKKLRPRSLKKLFQNQEIAYIQSSENSMKAFWKLWTIKESVYKAWQRQHNSKPIFNPISFNCQNIQENLVSVCKDDFYYQVETVFTPDYIYSQCKSDHINHKIFKCPKAFSEFNIKWYKQGLEIKKSSDNIPYLFSKKNKNIYPISLSHDNQFTALNWLDIKIR